MNELDEKLIKLLNSGFEHIGEYSESEMSFKLSPEKWSKKEALGHLIDSGIINLQRFTEIQFESLPHKIRPYKQDDLVIANDYQNSETKELLRFWKSINIRIAYLFSIQTNETLNFKIVFDTGEISDLKFLMEDYVNHLEYHLNQI
ncbi:DinB family protein [Thalassobellus sediminis]|uniref:DinB family protein n=1 Tax=Thalassobellus sediminis TaxID=3367753 RepID=UPI0037AF1155